MSAAPTRVLLVDAEPIFRLGLRALLAAEPDMETVGEADSATDLEALLASQRPDVAVAPAEAVRTCAAHPGVRVVAVVAAAGADALFAALLAGAAACVRRDVAADALLGAIRGVARGEALLGTLSLADLLDRVRARGVATPAGVLDALSARQRDVLGLVAEGKTNAQIARTLGLSAHTVKTYLPPLLKVLGASRRSQAAAIYAREAPAP